MILVGSALSFQEMLADESSHDIQAGTTMLIDLSPLHNNYTLLRHVEVHSHKDALAGHINLKNLSPHRHKFEAFIPHFQQETSSMVNFGMALEITSNRDHRVTQFESAKNFLLFPVSLCCPGTVVTDKWSGGGSCQLCQC